MSNSTVILVAPDRGSTVIYDEWSIYTIAHVESRFSPLSPPCRFFGVLQSTVLVRSNSFRHISRFAGLLLSHVVQCFQDGGSELYSLNTICPFEQKFRNCGFFSQINGL